MIVTDMKYRFSPIKSEEELLRAVEYLHKVCHEQCKQVIGRHLPARGCVAVFAHDDDEFAYLTELRQRLTNGTPNYNGKYFELRQPINIPEYGGVPAANYEFLYIHRPEARLPQVGDVDFVLPINEYEALAGKLNAETFVNGMRLFPRPEEKMIELRASDVDAITYVATNHLRDAIAAQEAAP